MTSFFFNDKFPRNLGLLFGLFAGLIFFLLSSQAFTHGPSSVGSSIGLLMTYIATPIIAFIGYLIGASFGFLIFVGMKRRDIASTKGVLSAVFLAAIVVLSVAPFYHYVHTNFIIHQIEQMNRAELLEAIHQYQNESPEEKPLIYSAIVTHPYADADLFHQLVMLQEPSLTENMWSITGLLGKNTRGFPVLRLIAHNQYTRTDTLNLLAESDDYYILEDVSGNPNTSIETLYKIHKKNPNVYLSFLWNPKTPSDILIDISRSLPDYLYSSSTFEKLINHPNMPLEQREKIRKPKY